MSFLLVFVPPLALALGTTLAGWAVVLPVVVIFGAIPLLDQLLAKDEDNTPGPAWLRWLPHAYIPVHLLTLGWALVRIASGELGPVEAGVLTLGAGLATAAAINVAHELMHRPGRVEQALAAVLMSTATYTHFCVEHVQGHHKNVATPRDPATARAGEALYAFLPRTLMGGLRSAWDIEVARSGTGWRNRLVRYAFAQGLLVAALLVTLGPVGLAAFLGQSLVAVLMLETINYVEHYGLARAETAPGRFERVAPRHSWNSSHRVSNGVLLNLARHSDHHAFAARAFRELRHHEDAPQLPAGYSAMLLLALVPPLWFAVMDRQLATQRQAA